MSGDEVLVLFASGGLALVAWLMWYARAVRFGRVPAASRAPLLLAPLVGAVTLFGALRTLSAHDVRDAPIYVLMYLLLGAAWVALGMMLLPLLGLSARDDVLERGNRAAADVVAGAIIAVTLCFIGANIGDGPGWWVVVFSAALSTGALFVVWFVLELATGVSDVVTIDRDRAAGVRLAGFLLASGAIFGRGAAGDWESVALTVRDFADVAMPAIPLLLLAAIIERALRPTPSRPRPPVIAYGAFPAAMYIGVAVLVLMRLGIPA